MKGNPNDIFLMAASGLLFSALVLAQTTFAQNAAGPADPRLGKEVKYATKQASVQDIVQNLAEQVGLKYDWQKSFDQTDPLCRRWVRNVAIEGKTCREALEQILKPVGLRYQVEDGVLVLSRQPSASAPAAGTAGKRKPAAAGPADPRLDTKVSYTSAQASVQAIVQKLAEQAGLKYDWQKSFNQTDPLCRRWVRNVAIEGKTCREALEQILKPVGLRYQVENGVLVLSRQDKGAPPPRSGDPSDSPPIGKGPAWGQSNVLTQAAQPADASIRLAALHPGQMAGLKGRPLCVYNFTTW